jgi:hypothetical protein
MHTRIAQLMSDGMTLVITRLPGNTTDDDVILF